MKKILRIARVELSILFYSPIAWLVLIIFFIQSGITFADLLIKHEADQQLGYGIKSLTTKTFGGRDGLFAVVQSKLFLYIPLLTMGLMSRETSSGSIKLLLSSPVTTREIIFGKFLTMMIYGFLLISILLIMTLGAGMTIEFLDVKFVLGGILGLYLLICAYAAIGLFMSSLTAYQVVATISTLAVLAGLKFIGEIGKSIEFVRDITYWISIEGRVNNFINGLISSKDVIYFLMVISLFLSLTIMKLNAGRVIRSSTANFLRYSSLILITLVIGYISSLPSFTKYYDTTRFKDRTLTDHSQEVIAQLKKPITLTTYVNIINSNAHLGSPKFRNFDKNQFEQYQRYLPDMNFVYVSYYDSTEHNTDKTKTLEERARRSATAYGYDFEKVLSNKEINKVIDLTPEKNRIVRMLEYDGKITPLRMFQDMHVYPHEPEITAALKRLLTAPQLVGMVQGNDERSFLKTGDKAYQNIMTSIGTRAALINNGFEVIEISADGTDTIPENLTALVIADPKSSYNTAFMEKLDSYLDNGGNLLIAGEPDKQSIINPIVEKTGVKLADGLLLQESKDFSLDLVQVSFSKESKALFPFAKKEIVSMPGVVELKYDTTFGYKVMPVLITDKNTSWNKFGKFNLETDNVRFDPANDVRVGVPTVLALTKKVLDKEQKILIAGDADFMSNGELGRRNLSNKNADFVLKIFAWFTDNEFPIEATRPEPVDNVIKLSKAEIEWMKMILIGLFPMSLLFAGGVIIVKRKRK
ncbi:MAG: Gldg family protein [Ginsengibacter sp.]